MFLVFQMILLWIVHFVPGFLEFSHKNTSDAHRGQNGFPPTLLRLATEGFLLMSLPHQEVRTSTWGIATLMFHYKVLRRRWVSICNKCYTQPRKSHQLPPNVVLPWRKVEVTSCFHCIMQGKSSPRWVTSCLTMQAILGGLCILLPLLAVSQVQRDGGFGELVA